MTTITNTPLDCEDDPGGHDHHDRGRLEHPIVDLDGKELEKDEKDGEKKPNPPVERVVKNPAGPNQNRNAQQGIGNSHTESAANRVAEMAEPSPVPLFESVSHGQVGHVG
jgi:hypothetical protein